MTDSQGASTRAKGKSFLSLITDVPHLISQLIRAEIELLKAELISKLKSVGIGLGLFVISLSLILLALLSADLRGSLCSVARSSPVGGNPHRGWRRHSCRRDHCGNRGSRHGAHQITPAR